MRKTFLCSLLLFLSIFANAQWMSVPTTIKTPYGNVQSSSMVYMPMNYGSGKQTVFKKAFFKVVLNNDSVIHVKASVEGTGYSPSKLVTKGKGDKQAFNPEETKALILESKNQKDTIYAGVPYNNKFWLFSPYPKDSIPVYRPMLDYLDHLAFLKIDGEFVPLTKELTISKVQENPKALKYAEKNKLVQAIYAFNQSVQSDKKRKGNK